MRVLFSLFTCLGFLDEIHANDFPRINSQAGRSVLESCHPRPAFFVIAGQQLSIRAQEASLLHAIDPSKFSDWTIFFLSHNILYSIIFFPDHLIPRTFVKFAAAIHVQYALCLRFAADKFIPFKTPLDSRYDSQIPDAKKFNIEMLFASCKSAKVSLFPTSCVPY